MVSQKKQKDIQEFNENKATIQPNTEFHVFERCLSKISEIIELMCIYITYIWNIFWPMVILIYKSGLSIRNLVIYTIDFLILLLEILKGKDNYNIEAEKFKKQFQQEEVK